MLRTQLIACKQLSDFLNLILIIGSGQKAIKKTKNAMFEYFRQYMANWNAPEVLNG